MDFRTGKIKNQWIAAGLASGSIYQIVTAGSAGIITFLTGCVFPVVILFALFWVRGLGAGDIKLFAVAGGFLGARALMTGIVYAFGIGGILALLVLIGSRCRRHTLHFSICVLAGVLLCCMQTSWEGCG